MEKFIVAGIQRTGTSLITSTLDQHSRCRCFGETFLFRKGRGGNVEGSYRRYINQKKVKRSFEHYVFRRRIVRKYLDSFYSKYFCDGYDAVGFKIMGAQTKRFPAVISYCQDMNIKVISIVRENYLRTYLSRLSLWQNRIAHSKEKVAIKKVQVPTKRLVVNLEKIKSESSWAERAFPNNPMIKISYEGFVANKSEELEKIFTFLSIKAQSKIESDLVKVNPNNFKDYIINYKEVEKALSGSAFEDLFYS